MQIIMYRYEVMKRFNAFWYITFLSFFPILSSQFHDNSSRRNCSLLNYYSLLDSKKYLTLERIKL